MSETMNMGLRGRCFAQAIQRAFPCHWCVYKTGVFSPCRSGSTCIPVIPMVIPLLDRLGLSLMSYMTYLIQRCEARGFDPDSR